MAFPKPAILSTTPIGYRKGRSCRAHSSGHFRLPSKVGWWQDVALRSGWKQANNARSLSPTSYKQQMVPTLTTADCTGAGAVQQVHTSLLQPTKGAPFLGANPLWGCWKGHQNMPHPPFRPTAQWRRTTGTVPSVVSQTTSLRCSEPHFVAIDMKSPEPL